MASQVYEFRLVMEESWKVVEWHYSMGAWGWNEPSAQYKQLYSLGAAGRPEGDMLCCQQNGANDTQSIWPCFCWRQIMETHHQTVRFKGHSESSDRVPCHGQKVKISDTAGVPGVQFDEKMKDGWLEATMAAMQVTTSNSVNMLKNMVNNGNYWFSNIWVPNIFLRVTIKYLDQDRSVRISMVRGPPSSIIGTPRVHSFAF